MGMGGWIFKDRWVDGKPGKNLSVESSLHPCFFLVLSVFFGRITLTYSYTPYVKVDGAATLRKCGLVRDHDNPRLLGVALRHRSFPGGIRNFTQLLPGNE